MSERDPRSQEQKRSWTTNKFVGQLTVAFTIGVKGRQSLFQRKEVVQEFTQTLADCCEENSCEIPIYCFMPDHLHLMVRGKLEYSNTKAVVDRFIFRAGFWLRTNDYSNQFLPTYDAEILKDEDRQHVMRHIALIPVSAGLITDPSDYSNTGSIGIDRSDLFKEVFPT